MKINKILNEAKLKEAEENIEDVVIDPTASTAEVANQVKDAIEVQTDNNATLSDAKADNIAAEIKDTANEVDAGEAAVLPPEKDIENDDEYITENALTRTLDKALKNARKFKRRGQKIGSNVLIVGLPGSGKTAIFEDWCHQRGVKFVPINAKNNKLETAIDGMPMRVNGTDEVAFLPTDLLKPLAKEECVLFLDEFNRQTNPQIRGALLTLINEKRTADGKQDFSNTLLFTVAIMNPAVPTDPGASALNDAEKSRFIYKVTDFDSDNDTALNYNDVSFANKMAKLGIDVGPLVGDTVKTRSGNKRNIKAAADLSEEQFDDAVEYIKIWDITKYILATLQFDTKDDLLDLKAGGKTLLNARLLTDAVADAGGDREELLDWVDYNSDMLDKDKQQFHDILDDYIIDINYYLKKLGLIKGKDGNTESDTEAGVEVNDVNNAQVDSEEDDDDGLFMSGGSANTISPAEFQASLSGIFDAWFN